MRMTPRGFLLIPVTAVAGAGCARQQVQPAAKVEEEDPLTELARYRAQAEKGDPDVQYRLAVSYAVMVEKAASR